MLEYLQAYAGKGKATVSILLHYSKRDNGNFKKKTARDPVGKLVNDSESKYKTVQILSTVFLFSEGTCILDVIT